MEAKEVLYTEFAAECRNHKGEKICGDNFVIRHTDSGRRTIAVLSDGMGHGMRANILSTLTSSMVANFAATGTAPKRVARMLDAMLPVNAATGKSYATLTLASVDNSTGRVSIMQYDNPPAILLRRGVVTPLEWSEPYKVGEGRPGKLVTAVFTARRGDRLVMLTDGVTQSGQAQGIYRFGWGQAEVEHYCSYLASDNPSVGSADFARQLVSRASANDGGKPSDDMSCAVLTFREPRRMTLVSCPPALAADGEAMAREVLSFDGEKVICGQPVASMIASVTGDTLEQDERRAGRSDFPVYALRGFDVVTDGMIVPGRILDILEHSGDSPDSVRGTDVPSRIARMLLRNDVVSFKIGMRRNIDPRGIIPDEFSIRRNILRRIISILEQKPGKTVEVKYF